MNWYLAKMVYRIFCGSGNHTAQFDEQIRLIHAEDELHAFHKARLIGDSERANDEDLSNLEVHWKFIDVTELVPIIPASDGAEIYASVNEEKDAETYIRNTQKRATQLLQKGLHNFTGLN